MDKLASYPKFQAFDSNGDVLIAGKVYTYNAGTTTPKTTYSDRALSTANANPVILDSRGECVIFFSGNMKIVLKDSDDNLLWTVDNLQGSDNTILVDADGDTKIQAEELDDEDKIRFDTGGTERAVLDSNGLELSGLDASQPVVTDANKRLTNEQPLSVAKGGSGVATLTNHGVMLGSDVGAVSVVAMMTDGQLLVGATDGDPAPRTVSGHATLAADGALTIEDDAVNIEKMQHGSIALPFCMAIEETEITHATLPLATVRTFRVYIPTDATTIKMVARMKTSNAGVGAWIRFDIGGNIATARYTSSTTYTWTLSGTVTLDVSALSGWQDLKVQIYPGTTGHTCYLQGYSFIWE